MVLKVHPREEKQCTCSDAIASLFAFIKTQKLPKYPPVIELFNLFGVSFHEIEYSGLKTLSTCIYTYANTYRKTSKKYFGEKEKNISKIKLQDNNIISLHI